MARTATAPTAAPVDGLGAMFDTDERRVDRPAGVQAVVTAVSGV